MSNVTVRPFVVDIDFKDYSVDSNHLCTKLEPGTTVDKFKSNVDTHDATIKVFKTLDQELLTTDVIGTGATIISYFDGNVVNTYKVRIYGDVNGDGFINLNDLTIIRDSILGVNQLEDDFKSAGDLYSEGKIMLNDLVGMMAYVSVAGSINQN